MIRLLRSREGGLHAPRPQAHAPTQTPARAESRSLRCQSFRRSAPSWLFRRPLPAAGSGGDRGSRRGTSTATVASSSASALSPDEGPALAADAPAASAAAAPRRPRFRTRAADRDTSRAGSNAGSGTAGTDNEAASTGRGASGAGSSGAGPDQRAASTSGAAPGVVTGAATASGGRSDDGPLASGRDGEGEVGGAGGVGGLGGGGGGGGPSAEGGDACDAATALSGDGGGSGNGTGAGNGGGGDSSARGGAVTAPYTFAEEPPLDLGSCRHFINLTNGIEALPVLDQLGLPYSFVRIQSTACEQQLLEALVAELDANLLVSLALGHCCLVYDCGSRARDGSPRALWYGLEFIRYTLARAWLRQTPTAWLRGRNVSRMFEAHVRAFKQSTTRRLQYYAKFLPPSTTDGAAGPSALPYGVRLYGAYRPTPHDDDAAFYVRLLHNHTLPPPQLAQPPSSTEALMSGSQAQTSGAWSGLPSGPDRTPGGSPSEGTEESKHAGAGCSSAGEGGDGSCSCSSPCECSDSPDGRRSRSRSSDGGGSSGAGTSRSAGVSASSASSAAPDDSGLRTGGQGASASELALPAPGTRPPVHAEAAAAAVEAGGGPPMRAAARPEAVGAGGAGGGVVPGPTPQDDLGLEGDGELVLARFGFRLFRRGLSPVEWVAAHAAADADGPSRARDGRGTGGGEGGGDVLSSPERMNKGG